MDNCRQPRGTMARRLVSRTVRAEVRRVKVYTPISSLHQIAAHFNRAGFARSTFQISYRAGLVHSAAQRHVDGAVCNCIRCVIHREESTSW